MIQFYDSSKIDLIPADADYVALYGDGENDQSGNPKARTFPHRRWITIAGLETCGIADFEPDNPIYDNRGALRKWAAARLANHRLTPIIYADRALCAAALSEVDGLRALLWIPTGDGKDWTAAELAEDLASGGGGAFPPVKVPASMIWGNQNVWVTDTYDRSNLFGDWGA